MKKPIAAILALATMFAGGSQYISASPYNAPSNKVRAVDMVSQSAQKIQVVSENNKFSGGDNPYRHYRKGHRNQKQRRAWVSSNRHLSRSKKQQKLNFQ